MRRTWIVAMNTAAFMAVSAPAYAVDEVPPVVETTVGGAALVLAIVLLVDVLALRRVAEGAAIAESIMSVVAAVVCLAASVLSGWVGRFMPGFVSSGFRLISDFLVLASMAFFAYYFYRVRRALQRFLKGATAAYPGLEDSDALAQAQLDPSPEDDGA